jgi:hypothetical protein
MISSVIDFLYVGWESPITGAMMDIIATVAPFIIDDIYII